LAIAKMRLHKAGEGRWFPAQAELKKSSDTGSWGTSCRVSERNCIIVEAEACKGFSERNVLKRLQRLVGAYVSFEVCWSRLVVVSGSGVSQSHSVAKQLEKIVRGADKLPLGCHVLQAS